MMKEDLIVGPVLEKGREVKADNQIGITVVREVGIELVVQEIEVVDQKVEIGELDHLEVGIVDPEVEREDQGVVKELFHEDLEQDLIVESVNQEVL